MQLVTFKRVRPAERIGTQSTDVVNWVQNLTVYDMVDPHVRELGPLSRDVGRVGP